MNTVKLLSPIFFCHSKVSLLFFNPIKIPWKHVVFETMRLHWRLISLKRLFMQRFIQKQKNFKLETKNILSNFDQYSRICETRKFHPKQKNKLWTKNVLLGLWAGMFKKCCHICNQRPPICLLAKSCAKLESLNLEPKMPFFGVLESNFENLLSFS